MLTGFVRETGVCKNLDSSKLFETCLTNTYQKKEKPIELQWVFYLQRSYETPSKRNELSQIRA